MSLIELFLTSFSLSFDAFVVSIYIGLFFDNKSFLNIIIISTFFGFFQFLMSFLGYNFGVYFLNHVSIFSKYVSFISLFFVSIMMFDEYFDNNINNKKIIRFNFLTLLILSIVTSLDALAVGFSFSLLNIKIYLSSTFIGCLTFLMSFLGAFLGYKSFKRDSSCVFLIGTLILLFISYRILV